MTKEKSITGGEDALQQIATVFIGGQEFIVRRENHEAFVKLIEMFNPDDLIASTGRISEWRPKWEPIEEWHEDDGPAFWTKFPVQEPFYSGSPLDVDWPENYYTHFIPMRVFYCTLDSDGMPLPAAPGDRG